MISHSVDASRAEEKTDLILLLVIMRRAGGGVAITECGRVAIEVAHRHIHLPVHIDFCWWRRSATVRIGWNRLLPLALIVAHLPDDIFLFATEGGIVATDQGLDILKDVIDDIAPLTDRLDALLDRRRSPQQLALRIGLRVAQGFVGDQRVVAADVVRCDLLAFILDGAFVSADVGFDVFKDVVDHVWFGRFLACVALQRGG
mmetsp:Transcript_3577/g.9474  ORF Transcript_3577/g.9474 Transcript_3577/m.9474 type:complete len:202 (+) Transcript_3577:1264-1869(+)